MIGVSVLFGPVAGAFTPAHREECGMYVTSELKPPDGISVNAQPASPGGAELLVEVDSPGLKPAQLLDVLKQVDSLIGDWSLVYGRTQAQHARDLRLEAQR